MKFNHYPSYREAMTSFDQTGLPIPQFSALIPLYAKLVGEDPEQGIYLMLKERNRRWRKIRARASSSVFSPGCDGRSPSIPVPRHIFVEKCMELVALRIFSFVDDTLQTSQGLCP